MSLKFKTAGLKTLSIVRWVMKNKIYFHFLMQIRNKNHRIERWMTRKWRWSIKPIYIIEQVKMNRYNKNLKFNKTKTKKMIISNIWVSMNSIESEIKIKEAALHPAFWLQLLSGYQSTTQRLLLMRQIISANKFNDLLKRKETSVCKIWLKE